MTQLVILPLILPFMTAIALLLLLGRVRWQGPLAILGSAALLLTGIALLHEVWQQPNGMLVMPVGNWRPPFGISFVADLLSATMVVVTGMIGLAVTVYSLSTVDRERQSFGYFPLLQILLMGVCGTFLTGDMFNLFVWFEVMLIASFVLLALGGERAQMEGAVKYVTLNLVSSAFLLTGVAVLYGMAGTLNMADLARQVSTRPESGTINAVAMLFLLAFGIKAAVFPLFFWLPASYHTPPIVVSALFAGLLTKVGVYALVRVFTLIFVRDVAFTHTLLLVIAGATMVTGVLGAVAQNDIRRILSFHIVSQIGYMVMGLALYSPLALAGSVFYIVHHIIVKTNLFLVGGVMQHLGGSYLLSALGGFYRQRPLLAILFAIPAFSLAGVPPLSGFWAKLILAKAGFDLDQFIIVAVALAVGMLTLFSMTKIWAAAFWKDSGSNTGEAASQRRSAVPWTMLAPIAALAACTVALGLFVQPLFALSLRAADQLLDREVYIRAVFQES